MCEKYVENVTETHSAQNKLSVNPTKLFSYVTNTQTWHQKSRNEEI